jgi:hypothetical protein
MIIEETGVPARSGAHAGEGLLRRNAATFDSIADRSSIGSGEGNALGKTARNVPYTIAGERVADHLSYYYESDAIVRSC